MTETAGRGRFPDEADVAASLGGTDPVLAGERITKAVDRALADHVLGARTPADVGQMLLACVTVFLFWGVTPHWMGMLWLAAFVATGAARAMNRKRSAALAESPSALLALVRRDVWISASLWGGWALVHLGADPTSLGFMLVIFAGLVAAATSTLVADRSSFLGFMGLLLGPLTVVVLLGEMTRTSVAMLLLIGVFAPFMLTVHRRAHGILVEQLRAGERLKVSEEETARRRDFLNSLVASAPSSIVVLDGGWRVVRVNPAFERVLGYAANSVPGRPFPEWVTGPRDQKALQTFLETVQEGHRAVAEFPLRRQDGSPLWARLSGTRAEGSAEGFLILVGEDVTDQVEAREAQMVARIQAEEGARAKSAFLASMSHEIRTPMNGVLGMIEILLDTPLTDDQRRSAEVIRSSGQGLLRILNDVLDVSKIEAGQLDLEETDFDVHEVGREVARVFAGAATKGGNELLLDVGKDVPRVVRGDPYRLRQILSNLVGNAVKFTADGEVVLSMRNVGAEGGEPRIRFGVRDTGVGIPLEKQEQIFREFEQADSSTTRTHGGTGLGLSISRRLVELMGGHIHLESVPGEGSDFSFELSLPLGREDRPADQRRKELVSLASYRFLVVDDNATARRIVREALAHAGAPASEATSVDEGLAAVGAAHDAGTPFDIVILDHMMPDRDGFDFVRALREDPRLPSVRVLMVTSAALPGGAQRARAEGIAGYLAKPLSRAELINALTLLVAGARPDGPERRLLTRETIARKGRHARILLAEDNPVNQQVALVLLNKRGHHVMAVPDGEKAVEAARTQAFDMVLMDIQMPVMDGLEATREIRKFMSPQELPIIALTAHAFAEERERSRVAGMNDFLAKPFKPDDLYELVDRWLPEGPDGGGGTVERRSLPRPEHSTPPVDLEGFRTLMREAGVEEVADATVEIYLSEAPRIFGQVEEAVRSGDPEAARRAAHSLKSASGNIRAARLADLLQAMEASGKAGDLAGVQGAFPALQAEFRSVMAYLETFR